MKLEVNQLYPLGWFLSQVDVNQMLYLPLLYYMDVMLSLANRQRISEVMYKFCTFY